MPLTDKQRSALEAMAKQRNISAANLISAAEALDADAPARAKAPAPGAAAKGDKPNLYLYHLPFVTVNEVRTIWLDLDPVSGGDEYAAVWSSKQGGGAKPEPTE